MKFYIKWQLILHFKNFSCNPVVTSINESRNRRSLLFWRPLRNQDIHRRKSETPSEPHQDPHQDQVRVAGHGAHGSEQGADNVDDDGHEEDPFAANHFGQPTAGDLGEEVSPEVGAQDEALLCLRPHEGTVLVLKIEGFFVRNLVCVFLCRYDNQLKFN